LNFAAPGHRRHCAHLRSGQCSGGISEGARFRVGAAFGKGDGKARRERIACAGGVHGFHFHPAKESFAVFPHNQVACVACLNCNRFYAAIEQLSRSSPRRLHVADLDAREFFGLAGVGTDDIDELQQAMRRFRGWRGIQDDSNAGGMGDFRGCEHSLHWHFELHQQHASAADDRGCGPNVRGRELVICAGRAKNLLFTAGVYHDERGSGWRPLITINVFDVETFGAQHFFQLIAAIIASEAGDERHASAQARSGDGLIRAFAAARGHEFLTVHRFAGPGQAAATDEKVGVCAADHDDFGSAGTPRPA